MPLVQLFIAAVVFVVGSLLRKGPPDAQPANFEDFNFPDVDPAKRIPIVWGKRRVSGLHTLDVQGFRTRRIRRGNFISGRTTVGFRYFASADIGICRGPAVTVTKIYMDNKVLWEGTATPTDDGFIIDIDDDEFFGSAGGVDDGVSGRIRIYAGSPTQNTNAVMAAHHASQGLPTPAYRHMCHAVFEDFYFGNQATVRQLEFEVERYPDTLGLGVSRQINTTPNISPSQGAVDLSLMEIINEALTSTDFGLGEPPGDVDTVSLTAAAATLAGENNAASLIWANGDSIEELLRIVMQQANGFAYKRLDSGQWEVNLARGDYLSAVSPIDNGLVALEVNEDNARLRNYSRGSWDETVNMVRVNWQDRNLKGRPQPADAQDMANFDIQGDVQLQSYTLPGVHSAELAAKMAGRFLKETAFPLAVAEVVVTRAAFNVNPGDVVRFSWEPLGIQNIFMRVVRIGYGEVDQSEIQLSLIQDVFGVAETSFGFPQDSLGTPQNPDPTQIDTAYVIDQGPWTHQQDEDNPLGVPKPLTLVAAPQGNSLQYTPFQRANGAGTFLEEAASFDFAAYGTLQSSLDPETVDRNTEEYATIVIENVNDVTDLDQTVTFSDDERRAGAGMIVIESENPGSPPIGSPQQHGSPGTLSVPEYLTYDGLSIAGNTVTLQNVAYAMDDTVPRKHLAGARVWFVTGSLGRTVTTYNDTDTVELRFRNETTSGNSDIDAATTFSRDLRNRANRPIVPGRVALAPKGSGPTSPATLSGFWPWPPFVFPQGTIRVRFARRNKQDVSMRLQVDGEPALVTDQSPQYNTEIEIWRGNPGLETFLRRVSFDDVSGQDGGIAFYDYTKAQQIADGGPYNQYIFIVRSYEGIESPRPTDSDVYSINPQRRRVKYNPIFTSPLYASPFSPDPIVPPSPTSPRYQSPVVSPLSPIHSPLSPVPSPTSPFPFLSPRSPILAPSPIPSPVPSFFAMAKAIGPAGPQGFFQFDGAFKKFMAQPRIENKGSYANQGDLEPENTANLPPFAAANVKGRDGHQDALRLHGSPTENNMYLSNDAQVVGKTGQGWVNISSPRAEVGAIWVAFRGEPQTYNPLVDSNITLAAQDYALWRVTMAGDSNAFALQLSSRALGNSPTDSPAGRSLRFFINGPSSSAKIVFFFEDVPPLLDGELHSFAVARPTKGVESPDWPYFYIDGVRRTPTSIETSGSFNPAIWMDNLNSTSTSLELGTPDTSNPFGADVDELLIWDNYTPTDEEMEFLHAAYDQENVFTGQSPWGKASPFPSPKQAWSPMPSPMSPDETYWNFKRILQKMNPKVLWDFSTVGPGSPILHNEGNTTYDYRLRPQGTGNQGSTEVSPLWNRSPLHTGLHVRQGEGADASRSPSEYIRFPESPIIGYAGNFEDPADWPSPSDNSPSELKNWSPDVGSINMVFRIPPRSPVGASNGYLWSWEYSGSNWGVQCVHTASAALSTIRLEFYTSTGSSSDMAITTPSDIRMDDNRFHVLSITKPKQYGASSPLTRKTSALEMYLDGEPVIPIDDDSSQLDYWFNRLTMLQADMMFAVGARGLGASSLQIQSAPGVDFQYFALTETRVDRRMARWMWDQFNLGAASPRTSPKKSPSSPVPSPLSPTQSPISPLPSPISPWTAISPHSPLGSPVNPSPVPPFEDIQALSDLVLEYTFNADTISPRVIANTGSLGAKGDLTGVAASVSPADYSFVVGGDQSASPVQAVNFTGSPSQNLLYRTLDASPSSSVVFDLDFGCVTIAFRADSGQAIPLQGANLFVLHVASTEYLRIYLQSDGKLVGYWRPLGSSSFERIMRSDLDVRDDRYHVAHFNFRNVAGAESPDYGRMYLDGKYQTLTSNTVDSGGRTRWISDINIINTIMVGGWDLSAPPDDAAAKNAFKGDIDYISVSAQPMRDVWIEGAASSYNKGRVSPVVSPV